jgi:hypothetical protein
MLIKEHPLNLRSITERNPKEFTGSGLTVGGLE